MGTLKRNFLYNSALTISNYIFPLLTFPYVTRVLGVANIGIYSFVDSIVNFFLLFATLGVSIVGIREISKSRTFENEYVMSQTFSNIFIFNLLFTIITLASLLIAVFFVPAFSEAKEMLYIGGAKILFSLFLIEWLYKGVEDFRYITIRSIIVKFVYVIAVFIFIREKNDYVLYFGLSAGMVFVNSIINWVYKGKYVRLVLKGVSFDKFSKPIFTLGIYMFLTSMYTSFNMLFLGFSTNEQEVGYYATATKLYGLILTLFTALTTVMLPRISSLVVQGNLEEVNKLINKSFEILFSFSVPVVIVSVILAPQIIGIIAGDGYEGAILPMRIVMPLVLVIGIAQILVIQILMPIKDDKSILINSVIGALLSVLLNILIVREMGSQGSAIVLLFSEIIVTICAAFFVYEKTGIQVPFKLLGKHLLIGIPYAGLSLICVNVFQSPLVQISIIILFSALYFLMSQLLFVNKGELIYSLKNILK